MRRKTQKDKALEMYREGKTWEEVAEATSNSTASRELTTYLPEAHQILKGLNQKIKDLRERIKESENQLKEIALSITSSTRDLTGKQEKIDGAQRTIEKLENKVRSLREEIALIENTLLEFADKGITKTLLTQLTELDVASWQDLLDRVSTSKKYENLIDQNLDLENRVKDLESQITKLGEVLDRLREEVKSMENNLDQTRRENSLILESAEIISEFLESGYTTEILQELLLRVKQLSIRGEPELSIKRFLSRMGSAKKFEELESQIINKNTELEALKRSLNETKGTLRTLKNDSIKPGLSKIDNNKRPNS